MRSLIRGAFETAKQILTAQRTKMDEVVELLKVEETVDAAQLDRILAAPERDAAVH